MKLWKCITEWDKSPHEIDILKRSGRGFLLTGLRWFLWALNIPMPLTFVRLLLCFQKPRQPLQRWHIELYVLVWLIVEILILRFLSSPNCWCLFVVTWRLIDILQTQYRLSFTGKEPIVIAARSLLLVLINYAEILMIFSVIYFTQQEHFVQPFDCTLNSFEYSISVFIPLIDIIQTHSPINCLGKIIFYFEILSSLFIHILIIQRVMSFFRR